MENPSSVLINGVVTDDDVIHGGWLTKSPPQKKIKNATSWTNRYFRLLYLRKESFESLKAQCIKIDPVEDQGEAEAEKNDENPNRLCLVFWKNEGTKEKPFRVISLRGCTVTPVGKHAYWGNKFPNLISLLTPTRKYFFSDRDTLSGQKWIEVLDEAIKLNDEGMLTVTSS